MKIAKLKEEIKNIREPRRTGYGNIRHKLEDIIIIGLCTVILPLLYNILVTPAEPVNAFDN